MRKVYSTFISIILVAGSLFSTGSFASDPFPRAPRAELTPGSYCQTGGQFRYPERIRYCERHVGSGLKNDVIQAYDQELGYTVRSMSRREFKIDHYIPLCAGGSNDEDNLWPQHKTVYEITDPLEPLVCEKMADGKLSQADAIALVREAKNDLSKVDAIIKQIESL